jgi:uncharacterized protein YoxC
MSDTDANQFGVLLEQIVSQNQAVLEAVGDMQQKVALLPTMQQDIAELKQDVKIVKAAVADVSRELADHVRQPSHSSGRVAHTVKRSRFHL